MKVGPALSVTSSNGQKKRPKFPPVRLSMSFARGGRFSSSDFDKPSILLLLLLSSRTHARARRWVEGKARASYLSKRTHGQTLLAVVPSALGRFSLRSMWQKINHAPPPPPPLFPSTSFSPPQRLTYVLSVAAVVVLLSTEYSASALILRSTKLQLDLSPRSFCVGRPFTNTYTPYTICAIHVHSIPYAGMYIFTASALDMESLISRPCN